MRKNEYTDSDQFTKPVGGRLVGDNTCYALSIRICIICRLHCAAIRLIVGATIDRSRVAINRHGLSNSAGWPNSLFRPAHAALIPDRCPLKIP